MVCRRGFPAAVACRRDSVGTGSDFVEAFRNGSDSHSPNMGLSPLLFVPDLDSRTLLFFLSTQKLCLLFITD